MSFTRLEQQLIGLHNQIDQALSRLKEENHNDKNELIKIKALQAKAIINSNNCKSIGLAINNKGKELLGAKQRIEQKMQAAVNQSLSLLQIQKQNPISFDQSQINAEVSNLINNYKEYIEALDKLTSEQLPSVASLLKVHGEIKNEINAFKSIFKSVLAVQCLNAINEVQQVLMDCVNDLQSHLNSIHALFKKMLEAQKVFKEEQSMLVTLLTTELNKFQKNVNVSDDSDDDVIYNQNPLNDIVVSRTSSQPIPRVPSKTQTPESKMSSDSGSDSSPSEEKRNPAIRRNLMATNSLFAVKKESVVANDTNNNVCETKNDSAYSEENRYKFHQTPNKWQKGFSLEVDEIDPNLTDDERRRIAISLTEKYFAGNPKDTLKVTGKDIMALYVKAYVDAMYKLAKHKDDKDKYNRGCKEFSPESRKPIEAEVKKMIKFLEKNKAEFLSKLKEPPKGQCCIM